MWTFPDYETDAIIQSSLRTELKNDVTVITVAHRLQTIMDHDKIVSLPSTIVTTCCIISDCVVLDGSRRWSFGRV